MDQGPVSKLGLSRIWILLAVVAAILLLGDLNRRMGDARRLERDATLLHTEVATLESQQSTLQEELTGSTTDAQVEEWARRQGRMVRDGERLVIPVPAQGVVAPTPEPAPTKAPLPSSWDVWWALLFGG